MKLATASAHLRLLRLDFPDELPPQTVGVSAPPLHRGRVSDRRTVPWRRSSGNSSGTPASDANKSCRAVCSAYGASSTALGTEADHDRPDRRERGAGESSSGHSRCRPAGVEGVRVIVLPSQSVVPLADDGLSLGNVGIVDSGHERRKQDVDDDSRLHARTRQAIEPLAKLALIGDQPT